jgi:hypothetical protein
MTVEPERLEPELALLLGEQRGAESPPLDARDRMLHRLRGSLGWGPAPDGGDGADGDGSPPTAGGAPDASASLSGAADLATGAGLLGKPLITLAIGLAIGGAAGASITHAVVTSSPGEAAVSAPLAPPTSAPPEPARATASATQQSPPPPPLSAPTAAAPATGARSAQHAAPAASSVPGADDQLAAERALIEVARTAIARKQSGSALSALDEHARKFPRGRLSMERQALRVHALRLAGRTDEATSAASTFHQQFPKSYLGPVVDSAVTPGSSAAKPSSD